MSLHIRESGLSGVVVIGTRRSKDLRGSFEETWSYRDLLGVGIKADFVQDNVSRSEYSGTVRGLHYQAPPHAQAKLVRCQRGAIFDVAVDIRRGSPTYGEWFGTVLSGREGLQLFVPEGFLHGFVTLEPDTEVHYKCTDYYVPQCEGAVRWDSLDIPWPINHRPVLSPRDAAAPSFGALQSPFQYSEPMRFV